MRSGRRLPLRVRHVRRKSRASHRRSVRPLSARPCRKLELLGPGHFFRRLEPLRFFRRILDRTILYDQRERTVIATEQCEEAPPRARRPEVRGEFTIDFRDRKSTRLNSSHTVISYAVFCLEK